ncbi:2'-5' RNA ligase family protein [Bombella sp. TMW 2.2559]|uniref:2'-5' RNA ligase family protein n=1 Tax=Bombella dulcis TaxID=2967339 RepID=A0ABT3W924_9PROT|nr:2'-5' RNA ligase family protein [Bombella dulcis]MCX5615575.1 2'-5' RNA ligase family protein [Bombella dulcis]
MKLSLALTLSPTIQAELGLLRGSLTDVHWTPAEQCMIPLHALGQMTSRHDMEELDLTLSHFHWAPFTLSLHQVSHQMGEMEDRLTVGVTPQQPLTALQKRLISALRRTGFPPSRRPPVPELTIARLAPASPTDLIPWIQRHNLFHSSGMMVDHISLVEHLPAGGEMHCHVLETYPTGPDLLSPLPEEESTEF